MRRTPGWLAAALLGSCRVASVAPGGSEAPIQVELRVDASSPVFEVDARYLSVALDAAQILGGEFWSKGGRATSVAGDQAVPPIDLASKALVERASALHPAYLRVGGSAADLVHYQLEGDSPLPRGDRLRLTGARWRELNAFAKSIDFPLVFALNAGPGSRDERGRWTSANATALVRAADGVTVWELGNEVNAYPFIHGLSHYVRPAQLGADLVAARRLLQRLGSGARLAGPASAFWPILGEVNGTMEGALRAAGGAVQVVTWHYYPQQSRRCPAAVRRAGERTLLDPDHLDELARWALEVQLARDAYAPSAELWLGETGHAQCGGEPGLSDAFAGSLWWIDELGLAARTGHRVVIRQTLAGSDYGLLDAQTLAPRPDYWASLLWKRTMGQKVLAVAPIEPRTIRAYAHCAVAGPPGATAIAAINLGERPAELAVPWSTDAAEVFVVTAPALSSPTIAINGAPPETALSQPPLIPSVGRSPESRDHAPGEHPPLIPSVGRSPESRDPEPPRLRFATLGVNGGVRERSVHLPPLSYAVAVFPRAAAPACAP